MAAERSLYEGGPSVLRGMGGGGREREIEGERKGERKERIDGLMREKRKEGERRKEGGE
jgi:hypothetical protein